MIQKGDLNQEIEPSCILQESRFTSWNEDAMVS